eukprot:1018191-Rhodomonas_salina.2
MAKIATDCQPRSLEALTIALAVSASLGTVREKEGYEVLSASSLDVLAKLMTGIWKMPATSEAGPETAERTAPMRACAPSSVSSSATRTPVVGSDSVSQMEEVTLKSRGRLAASGTRTAFRVLIWSMAMSPTAAICFQYHPTDVWSCSERRARKPMCPVKHPAG